MAENEERNEAGKGPGEAGAARGGEGRRVDRRTLLRSAMWGSTLLFLGQTATAGLAMFWPRKVSGFGSTINAGPVENFPVGSVTRFAQGKFFISRLEEGVIALYWKCPHLGCTVPWLPEEGKFHCPCHGSIYERTGQNIAGPAPRPMDYMNVTIENGNILVDTGNITVRERHLPEHVTPV